MTDRPSHGERNTATFSALAAVVFVGLGLLGLVALVLPQVLWILLIASGMGIFAVLHYVLWGRWLMTKLLNEQPQAKDSSDSDSNSLDSPRGHDSKR